MASWHSSLWLLVMGPCCPVVRIRCPELGWWFSATANGKKRIGNSDYISCCLFFEISRCTCGNWWVHSWSPPFAPVPRPWVIRPVLAAATWPRWLFPTLHTNWKPVCCLAILRGNLDCHSWNPSSPSSQCYHCHGISLIFSDVALVKILSGKLYKTSSTLPH